MKTIIAGSRGLNDMRPLSKLIKWAKADEWITEVVSGNARGVDALGEQWADANEIPLRTFPADWDKFGKAAGHMRNEEMAKYANALLFLWDGESPGTLNMINNAMKHKLTIFGLIKGGGYMAVQWE